MELKVKNLKISAGRPIVFLDEKTAERLNVLQNSRVRISNSNELNANVDLFTKAIKLDEVGFSKEVSDFFRLKDGSKVKVNVSKNSSFPDKIKQKIKGKNFDYEGLKEIMESIIDNNLCDAEIAYFLSVQNSAGMSIREIKNLTKAMVDSGREISFNKKIIADKHCIGGVAGNRTTPIVVSICAAAGLTIPKSSSKAITSAAGTADVMETITEVCLTEKELKRVVRKTGGCFVLGGSLDLSPSDEKINRIERILEMDAPHQMIASVLSKKISVGSKYLLLDIPYGAGAKISSISEAKKIGNKFKEISKEFDLKIKVVYTNGREPIGNGFGPILEMKDVISVLKNEEEAPEDLKKKSLMISSELMALCGIKNAKKLARGILEEGHAFEKFKEIINAQNGKKNFDRQIRKLTLAPFTKTIKSKRSGKISEINNKKINHLCRILGSPDTKTAGAYLHKHVGKIKSGEKLITLYSESKEKLKEALKYYKEKEILKVV